jgi:hypothetical protein
VSGEAALSERAGQGVRGGRNPDAGPRPAWTAAWRPAPCPGIVELELVDGQQPVSAQRRHGLAEAEGADQVGQLHEGAVRARLRRLVPERGQQVGLADAVAAVEVDTRPAGRRLGPAQQPLPGRLQGAGEHAKHHDRPGLRGVLRVGQVGREARVVERGGGTIPATSVAGGTTGAPVDQALGRHGEEG